MSAAHFENRKKHAARLWSEYTQAGSPRQLDKWLAQRLKAEKKFGSQDRRFYSNALFSAARYSHAYLFFVFCRQQMRVKRVDEILDLDDSVKRRLLTEFSTATSSESDAWSLLQNAEATALMEFVFQCSLGDHAEHHELAAFQKRCEERYQALTDTAGTTANDSLTLLLLSFGIPAAWTEPLRQRIVSSSWDAAQTCSFIRGQNTRAPLWIRLNHPDHRDEVEHDLSGHGLKVIWNGPLRASVEGSFGIYQCKTFTSGLFEIQDLASQEISASVKARPGERVWDACAGGGGKTVALAAELRGKGALYATDIRDYKLDEVKRRTQRAGFHNVRTMVWNGERALEIGLEVSSQSGFDAVLVDAPCSSSGTWRRNPDARFRTGTSLGREELFALQRQILNQAAAQVRPGGRLIYGTCSWCVEENERIADSFLKQNREYQLQTQTGSLGRLLGFPEHDSDTMYVAAFERRS